MGGGAAAKPSTVVPMPSVLDDDSSGSEEEIGGGDVEVVGTKHRHPTIGTAVEVSEGEAKARPLATPFRSVVYQAMTRHSRDVGAANVILDPLHLGELPFNFVFP